LQKITATYEAGQARGREHGKGNLYSFLVQEPNIKKKILFFCQKKKRQYEARGREHRTGNANSSTLQQPLKTKKIDINAFQQTNRDKREGGSTAQAK